MTSLEKRPCRGDRCDSKIFPGMKLPGYDAASDSIVTLTKTLVSEDYTITFETWPNYPEQELITVVDNIEQTTLHYQMNGDEPMAKCWNSSYNPEAPSNESDWHVVYIGETTRPEAAIEYMGETYSVPASINHVFRFRSNLDPMEEGIVYEQDSLSMTPKRLFMEMARESELDVEESITLEFKEMDQSDADALLEASLGSLSCAPKEEEHMLAPQRMEDPYDESVAAVSYFVDDLKINPDSVSIEDSYWAYAVENFNESMVDEYRERLAESSEAGEEGNETRRLNTCNNRDRDIIIPLGSKRVGIEFDRSAGLCVKVFTDTCRRLAKAKLLGPSMVGLSRAAYWPAIVGRILTQM
mmetsp:Transcript_49273/g.90882  ORF Transcript_49273/g.90882 Transcript_49273/m.90882 type:complete len:355 (+) Transcript_49273:640-1704(+)